MASYGQNLNVPNEVRDIVIADAALTIAFALVFSGGIAGLSSFGSFLAFIPIAFVAVTLSFVLHEYMHKIVAQRFGAIAGFRKWDTGIIITLASSLFGFLIGLPGATMIYASRFTTQEEGYVSLAGPLTNFVIFIVLAIPFFLVYHITPGSILFGGHPATYVELAMAVTIFICVWLAFFNMLPIYPLDGSKVLRWNRQVYALTLVAIFAFLYFAAGPTILPSVVLLIIISLFMYFMYRGLMHF